MWKNIVHPDKPQNTVQYRSNMVHVHCMLDNEGYRHTFRINVKFTLEPRRPREGRDVKLYSFFNHGTRWGG
jgi:hypothetical protein